MRSMLPLQTARQRIDLYFFFQRYSDQHTKLAAYLTWPDARLRAYLRQQGVSEEYIPGDRPSLLRTFATCGLYTRLLIIR